MAKIETHKSLVIESAKPAALGLNVGPGVVSLGISNEAIEHIAKLGPEEATQLGTAFIQLAYQAAALATQQRLQVVHASAALVTPPG